MEETLTQAQIDAMIADLNPDGMDIGFEYDEIEYHPLICLYCKEIIRSESLKTHCLMTNSKCSVGEFGHMYVSVEWLKDRRMNPHIAGWRRAYKVEPEPRIMKVRKIVSQN